MMVRPPPESPGPALGFPKNGLSLGLSQACARGQGTELVLTIKLSTNTPIAQALVLAHGYR